MSKDEFNTFLENLSKKLPVTFRLNPREPNIDPLIKIFNDPNFLSSYTDVEETGKAEIVKADLLKHNQRAGEYKSKILDIPPPSCKEYYKGRLLYEILLPREMLKKNLPLKPAHKLIQ